MENGRLAGSVAVVTGGAAGIGLATVRRFVAEGACVVIGDIEADRAAHAAAELGQAVASCHCDVRDETQVEALCTEAVDRFGRLDIAFANAGTGTFGLVVDTDLKEWMRVLEVNLVGPLLTVKHAARRMTDGGSIVVTASLNATQAARGMSAYGCSKAALGMLTQIAALELGPRRIRVNAVAPGLVRTGLTDAMWLVPGVVDEYDENAPLDTTTSPDDVANLVTFLASDESASMTGTLQPIDRGAHMMRYPDMPARFAEAAGGDGAPD
jgi:NAD(P)-dependent dehydrogenase (short-subunit alcohol dehydrogenase family)